MDNSSKRFHRQPSIIKELNISLSTFNRWIRPGHETNLRGYLKKMGLFWIMTEANMQRFLDGRVPVNQEAQEDKEDTTTEAHIYG